jgi:hypothetical protein
MKTMVCLVPKRGGSAPLKEDVQLQFPSCYRAWSPVIEFFCLIFLLPLQFQSFCTSVLFVVLPIWSCSRINSCVLLHKKQQMPIITTKCSLQSSSLQNLPPGTLSNFHWVLCGIKYLCCSVLDNIFVLF